MSTTTPAGEKAVTAAVIADELSVHVRTVYRLASTTPSASEIPGFRVGREWRFYLSAVRAHLTKPVDRWAQPNRSKARKRVGAPA